MKKAYKISELSTLLKRGITPSYTDALKVIVINQKCIRDYILNLDLARYTDPEKKKIADEKYLKSYDVLVNSTGVGTLGRVAQISEVNRPVTSDSHVTIVRPDDQTIDPLYFGYCLKSRQKHIEALGEGSTGQTELSRVLLGDMEIEILEDFREQKVVANFFKAIDDKIELNQKMNETLEEIAKTLFKSWFIDFDPVRAKAEGRPTGLSNEISDLFPDSFEDSELGKIPKGWELSKLSEIFDIQGGSQPPAKTFIDEEKEGYVRLLQIRDYDDANHLTYIPSKKNLRIVDEDDVLIGRYGSGNGKFMEDSLGRPLRGLSGAINVAIVRTIPKIQNSREFIAIMVSSGLFYKWIVGGSARAVQAGFKKEDLDYINLPVPSPEILSVFEEFGALVWKKIKVLHKENGIISKVRDTLLPKLISGELKIQDAEKVVEEAGI